MIEDHGAPGQGGTVPGPVQAFPPDERAPFDAQRPDVEATADAFPWRVQLQALGGAVEGPARHPPVVQLYDERRPGWTAERSHNRAGAKLVVAERPAQHRAGSSTP